MWPSTDRLRGARALALAAAVLLVSSNGVVASLNGSITVLWDANTVDTDLAGYRVYLATSVSVFGLPPAQAQAQATTRTVLPSTLQTTFTALDTSVTYHVAVTCYDTSGNESPFSNLDSALPVVAPVISSLAPAAAIQDDSGISVTINGSEFQPGATVSFGAGVTVLSVNSAGIPTRLVAQIDVDPLALVDDRDVVVTNPGGISGTRPNGFSVTVDRARVDINSSSRIDGGDLIPVAAKVTATVGNPGYSTLYDLNVDGRVDGTDVALLITFFGMTGPF